MTENQNIVSTVWVVIPTFNRAAVLGACLDDLMRQTHANVRVLVVDDASSDETARMLRERYPQVDVLRGDGDRWWSGAMNLGLGRVMVKASASDYVLSFNDDVRIDPEYVQRLVTASRGVTGSRPLIGSLAVDSSDEGRVVFSGTRIDWSRGLWKGMALPAVGELIATDSLPGRGVLIPCSVIEAIGFYDDRRFPQYFGDEDFALRAKAAGFPLFVSRSAVVRSHVLMTGTGRHGQTLGSFLKSLRSIRSPNQLSRRLAFVCKHCPWRYRLQFALLDTLKVTTAFWRRRAIRGQAV